MAFRPRGIWRGSLRHSQRIGEELLQQFVGSERVFPTQNGAPRIMTEFLNKPCRFELRDEYTEGPNPRPLPTVKASYYHGKPAATQKVLEHF